MSAYIVNNETISVLVKAFEVYGAVFKADNYVRSNLIFANDERDAIGQALLQQNYDSVNYRYGESTETPKYKYKSVEKFDMGIVYGCIQCYEYQACETNDYFDSTIHKSLVGLKDAMLKRAIREKGLEIVWGYDGFEE